METLKAMKTRKSTRSYTGSLSEADLQAVLIAGEAAPIGMGKYEEMHMTVIRDQELMNEINASAAAFFKNPEMVPLYGAPCLILISTKIENPAMGNVPFSDAAVMAENMTQIRHSSKSWGFRRGTPPAAALWSVIQRNPL